METLAILEFLGRRGDVIRTERISHFPVTLGRAVDNDVIISDPYLAPFHIRIEKNEQGFRAIHLNSQNGMSTTRNPARRTEIQFDGDTVLRLGHTQIRLRGRGEAIPPEQILPPERALRHPLIFTLSLAAVTSTFWIKNFLVYPVAIDFENSGAAFVLIMAKLLAWIAIWSGVGKFLTGKGLFFKHGALASLGLLVWVTLAYLVSLVAFAFSWAVLQQYAYVLLALVLWGVVYRHVSLISRGHKVFRAGMALLLTLVLHLGYWAYYHSDEKKDWGVTEQHVELWPVSLLAVHGESVETFFLQADEIRREVNAKRHDNQ